MEELVACSQANEEEAASLSPWLFFIDIHPLFLSNVQVLYMIISS